MTLRYNKQHLINMLGRDTLDRADKQAIRFALWAINSQPHDISPASEPVFPFWRNERYTDDGCSLYQCLNCKQSFEGRSGPGYMNHYKKVMGICPRGGQNYDTSGDVYHYAKLDEPEYHPEMFYCPFCAVKWEGPIRRDEDNESMRGDRRLKIDRAMRKWKPVESTWYWVMQSREVWPDRDAPSLWTNTFKMDPNKSGAVQAFAALQLVRERCAAEDNHSKNLFNVQHEARIIKKRTTDLKSQYPGSGYYNLREPY